MDSILQTLSAEMSIPVWLLIIVFTWSLFWKAIALWKSARSKQIIWFIVFLFVQTMGIVEILYIFLFSKISLPTVEKKKKRRR